jgi:hypothetical protein
VKPVVVRAKEAIPLIAVGIDRPTLGAGQNINAKRRIGETNVKIDSALSPLYFVSLLRAADLHSE